mgnify:CR=1 FL=1
MNLPSLLIGGVEITGEAIVTLGVTIFIMVALTSFMKYTKTGMAMLAVAEDKGAAQLMGINVKLLCRLLVYLYHDSIKKTIPILHRPIFWIGIALIYHSIFYFATYCPFSMQGLLV